MKQFDGNPYKKGTKAYEAYNKGFNDCCSYYKDLELERLKGELVQAPPSPPHFTNPLINHNHEVQIN